MAKSEHALVREDGSLVGLHMVEESKIAPVQDWPKYFPVARNDVPPTRFHSKTSESSALVNGQWVITTIYQPSCTLEEAKASLKRDVDAHAERTRLQFITPGDGQAMSYEAKRTEARRWVLAGEPASPDAEEYPWAAGRAERKASTIAAVLTEWKETSDAWAQIAIAIESIREGSKEAVSAAQSIDAACEIYDAIDWSVS